MNNGNTIAHETTIKCYIDDTLIDTSSVDIVDETYYTDAIEDINIQYDKTVTVTVGATYQDQTQSDSVILKAELPRQQTEDANLFITPYDPVIIELRNQIVRNKPIHWMALRNWVGSNIEYEYDSNQFRKNEYWLLSRETLSFEQGDCEDQAILLCSLLRADGWDPDDVYVIIGMVGDEGHAWVSLKIFSALGQELWINLEPTAGGFLETQYADISSLINQILGQTTRAYKFNDVSYEVIG